MAHFNAFHGRQWLFSKTSKYVQARHFGDESRAGILLLGGAGTGKTAVCRRLVPKPSNEDDCDDAVCSELRRTHTAAVHFLRHDEIDEAAAERLADSIGTQLEARLDTPTTSTGGNCRPLHEFIDAIVTPPRLPQLIVIDNVQSAIVASAVVELCERLPPWLTLLVSTRSDSDAVSLLSKHLHCIQLDNIDAPHIVHDLQEYILCRLDTDTALRQQLDLGSVDRLHRLHLASNASILYIRLVCDAASAGYLRLAELPNKLPCGLEELYVYLCEKLFENFNRVRSVLEILLARSRLTHATLLMVTRYRLCDMSDSEFNDILARLGALIEYHSGMLSLSAHFAEWLTSGEKRFECHAESGHLALALHLMLGNEQQRTLERRQALAYHIQRVDQAALRALCALHGVEWPTDTMEDSVNSSTQESQVLTSSNKSINVHEAAASGDLCGITSHLNDAVSAVDASGDTCLNIAAKSGHNDIVSALCQAGANVNHAGADGWIPLRGAAFNGHIDCVRTLLQHGADVDRCGNDGRRALRTAAWSGHAHVVALLLQSGADVNAIDAEGRTALMTAVFREQLSVVRTLLAERRINVNIVSTDGSTALHLCSTDRHVAIARTLIAAGIIIDACDAEGHSALWLAAAAGALHMCNALLDAGADVDLADTCGCTPMHAACVGGYTTVVDALIVRGADVNWMDAHGRSALTLAAMCAHASTVRSLLAYGLDEWHADNDGWLPIHHAAAATDGHDCLSNLIAHNNATLNARDAYEHHTPLYIAVAEGQISNARTLLTLGADVNMAGLDGDNALRRALLMEDRRLIDLLFQHNAALDHCDVDGHSLLESCLLEGATKYIGELLNACDENTRVMLLTTRDRHGRTPMHLAAARCDTHAMTVLAAAGADLEATDEDNNTPLMCVLWSKSKSTAAGVRALLTLGARHDSRSRSGNATALHIAAQGVGGVAVAVSSITVLLEHGADASAKDNAGRTPAHVATACGMTEAAAILARGGSSTRRHAKNGTQGRSNSSGVSSESHSANGSWSQGSGRSSSLSSPDSDERVISTEGNAGTPKTRARIVTNPKYRSRSNAFNNNRQPVATWRA